ncbi:hypothetical protein SLS62_009014 [Diatrype stigma]|uniref:Major facilitator superfamily (MFS) profile domain-containing protein n=1 Tax=Diatrype stigma TaxID=117547 RepID=A0AAN9YJQ4_9PEZI
MAGRPQDLRSLVLTRAFRGEEDHSTCSFYLFRPPKREKRRDKITMSSTPGADHLVDRHDPGAPEIITENDGDEKRGGDPTTAAGARTGEAASDKAMGEIIRNAKLASDKEHNMTLLQGIKLYPKAIAWSILISTCIIMEGYDIALVNNFYAFPQFNRKYGEQLPDGTWQVPAAWQAGLSNGAVVGEIIGLVLNGWVSERFGYRYTVIGCLGLVTAFISIYFTAQTVVHLQIASILCGIPWGVFQTLTITYASEVCPVALRGYLTTYINMCWGIGQMLGIATIMGNLWRTDEWAYRIPYALQWMWPLPLAIGIYFAPESPWWLVRKQRLEEAKQSLLRLTSLDRATDFDADETVAMMVHTTALEQKVGQRPPRDWDFNIVGIVCGVLTPYMINPGAWNWGNYAGFFWAGLCFFCLVYTYFRVPEPSGRTFAELDLLFEKKVSARKFASTDVDVFAEHIEDDVMEKYQAQISIANMEKSLIV